MTNLLSHVCALVRDCGRTLREIDRAHLGIDAKSGKANFVTEYDRLTQARLREGLRAIMPEAGFVGEEGSEASYSPKGRFWIVDPIDGTTNFIKDYRYSAISVALVVDDAAELAVVYNPYADELFTATRGGGAFLVGGDHRAPRKRLSVSREPLENGLVLFGTSPYYEELSDRSFEMAKALFKKALDVRRSGSAALDLCTIAAGRAELFFELRLAPWDYAAGALLVTEAGGRVTDVDGNPPSCAHACSVLATGSGCAAVALSDLLN